MECMTLYICEENIDESLDDVRLILFTSGTTSTPKAIMLTEKNIFSNIESISSYLNINSNDKILLIKNLCHSSSIIGELLVGIINGCTIVLSSKVPMTRNILWLIEENNISVFFAVPTILKGILDYSRKNKVNLEKLRIINFYGAPMNKEDISSLIKLLPSCNLIYSYGQTEASQE